MSTTVCPNCGANLDSSARFCASCGQGVGGPAGAPGASPAAGRKVPVLPIAIFGGGLVVLVGALAYMKSNAPPPGAPAPGPVPAVAASAAPAAPVPAVPVPTAPAEAPVTQPSPATTSAFSVPDNLPPGAPPSPASPGAAPAAPPVGNWAPSAKSWKDPLASDAAGAPPQQVPVRVAAARPAPPQGQAARPPAPPQGQAARPPAPPSAPQISQTYDCRENAIFNITPEDISISVDGHSIGTADRWDGATEGRKYAFREPGTHLVKLSHEKYETVWLKFEVSERSIYRTADVELQMKRVNRKGD